MNGDQSALSSADDNDRTMLHVIYGAYLLSFIIVFSVFIGVIIAYIERGKRTSTFHLSHLQWQIRTFWLALSLWIVAMVLVGIGTIIPIIGMILILIGITVPGIWFVYRVVKGWYILSQGEPIRAPGAFF